MILKTRDLLITVRAGEFCDDGSGCPKHSGCSPNSPRPNERLGFFGLAHGEEPEQILRQHADHLKDLEAGLQLVAENQGLAAESVDDTRHSAEKAVFDLSRMEEMLKAALEEVQIRRSVLSSGPGGSVC